MTFALPLRVRRQRRARTGSRPLGPRVALSFLLVALAPLALGGWLLDSWTLHRQQERVDARLQVSLQAGLSELGARVAAAERRAAALAGSAPVQEAMLSRRRAELARIAAGARDTTISLAGDPAHAAPRPTLRRGAVVLRGGRPLGRVDVSVPLDRGLLARLRAAAPLRADEGFLLVQRGRVVAGPSSAVGARLASHAADVDLAGTRYRAATAAFVAGRAGVELVALAPHAAIDVPAAHARRVLILALAATLGMIVLLGGTLGEPLLRGLDELSRNARNAVVDELTGLPNRRAFREEAQAELRRCARLEEQFAVVLADVDRFKQVNDMYGHAAGDDVLRLVGSVLREQAREIDLPARWGGEEFAILLRGTDAAGGRAIAERIRVALAEREAATDAGPLRVTASFGVAAFPRASGSLDGLLEEADRALYSAKESGRDRVVVAGAA
jgi:diguanylate cyclase (GGDEF)-like protein